MKRDMRLILTLLLLTFAAPAWAEWVKYDENDDMVYYYDPTTIKKSGQFRRVWTIQDLKQRHKDGALSMLGLRENDCKEERTRYLSVSGHSERMARGKVLGIENVAGKWAYIAPGTIGAAVMKIVCQ